MSTPLNNILMVTWQVANGHMTHEFCKQSIIKSHDNTEIKNYHSNKACIWNDKIKPKQQMTIGYNIILPILQFLVHKISIPQKKYTNKFLTLAILKRYENGLMTYFLTRSYDQWQHADDTRARNMKQMQ